MKVSADGPQPELKAPEPAPAAAPSSKTRKGPKATKAAARKAKGTPPARFD